jgi:hypothetical protein
VSVSCLCVCGRRCGDGRVVVVVGWTHRKVVLSSLGRRGGSDGSDGCGRGNGGRRSLRLVLVAVNTLVKYAMIEGTDTSNEHVMIP